MGSFPWMPGFFYLHKGRKMQNGKERKEIINGTKCETCCDSGWCWNALKESLRALCLGPFKDFQDFQEKFRADNSKGEVTEKERAKSLRKHIRKTKLEEYRENRMQCDLFGSEKPNDDE
jgi:hypothetical protein